MRTPTLLLALRNMTDKRWRAEYRYLRLHGRSVWAAAQEASEAKRAAMV